MSRAFLTRSFLWVSVLSWGIGLGAKLFDLMVLAAAWGATPPASLAFYPYGRHYPLNPGDFFQPLSAVMAVGVVGTLISGWKTPSDYRLWLWIPAIAFLIIWISTPTVFWPLINDIYASASGKVVRSDAELVALVRRWFVYDWLRVALIALGFIASIRAISLPYISSRNESGSGV